MRNFVKYLTCVFALTAFLSASATAQSETEQNAQDSDNGFILEYLEEAIETENFKLRLSGVSGLLASQADVKTITIADREGIWLTISDAKIKWNRAALLGGRVNIERLGARLITVERQPLPDTPSIAPEATQFSLPELPVALILNQLDIEKVALNEPVLGFAADLALAGDAELRAGALETNLQITRLDPPGGTFRLAGKFDQTEQFVAVDLALSEPQGGLVAQLLGIAGEPAIDLKLRGSGPVKDLDLALTLDANDARLLVGTARLRGDGADLAYDLKLRGDLRPLVPANVEPFFGAISKLDARGQQMEGGGFSLQDMTLETARLRLRGGLRTTPDGFLRQAKFEGSVGDGRTKTILPFGAGQITARTADFKLDFGNAQNGRWTSEFTLEALETARLRIADMQVSVLGNAFNLDTPKDREISFALKGKAEGLDADDPDLRRALGRSFTFDGKGDWAANAALALSDISILGNGFNAALNGTLKAWKFTGKLAAELSDLTPFSGLAARDLRGALAVSLEGNVSPLTGGFDLNVKGNAENLKLDPSLDALLDGATRLKGQVTRDETGFRTKNLSLANAQFSVDTDGVISTELTDFAFNARIEDLTRVSRRLSGAARLRGTAKGSKNTPIDFDVRAQVPRGSLMRRPLRDLQVTLEGQQSEGAIRAALRGAGSLDSQRVLLRGDLEMADAEARLKDLTFIAGGSTISGSLKQTRDGLFDGALNIAARDITTLALLALREGSGALNAQVDLRPTEGQQTAQIEAQISQLHIDKTKLRNARAAFTISDALGVPIVNGRLAAQDALVAGVAVKSLTADAVSQGTKTRATANLVLSSGAQLRTALDLTPQPEGFALGLSQLLLTREKSPVLRLTKRAELQIKGSDVILQPVSLSAGEGKITAQGQYGETVALVFDIADLPLEVANAIDPSLGLSGRVSGRAIANGPREDPRLEFEITGSSLSSRLLQASGAPLLDFEARGKTKDEYLKLSAKLEGGGLVSELSGLVPTARGDLDLEASLERFPLVLLDRISGRQGLSGVVTGKAQIVGPPSDPTISFDVTGERLSARIVRVNRIAPVSVKAKGRYLRDEVGITNLSLSNADGLAIDANGTIPLLRDGLDLSLQGRLPLSVANVVLAERGARATGVANIQVSARGRVAQPDIRGTVRLANGAFVDPLSNIRLEDLQFLGVFSGARLTIRELSARNSRGGTLAASGSISLDTVAGLPIDLTGQVRKFRYTDGLIFSTIADADIALNGRLRGRAELSGAVTIGKTEITLPRKLGGSGVARLDVAHINAPFEVRQTLARAERRLDGARTPPARSGDMALNLVLNAPRQIFLRGRGIDAELGGQVLIGGTLGKPAPVGRFDLVRGRINLLGQRIDLTEGGIGLTGTLDPQLDLAARTQTDAVTAMVQVSGNVSAPEITISSTPELPQDEVLARILFDRPLAELSALQVARLAAAAAELTGRGGLSFWERLRRNTGLDDLDFRTEADGETALRAGKYLQDNLYSTIEVNSRGESEVSLNLDISDALRARTTLDLRGNTSIGLFYEKDY